ncbi:alanine racemase [Pseudoxanthomonas wuyuanensis]
MRPARALIDLGALRHNYRLARAAGGSRTLAVIKADAYGHGAVRCAQALQNEADGFAVACIEEALELRQAGIEAPILLLEGFFDKDELPLIDRHGFWCMVHDPWQVEALERAAPTRPLKVWLKQDSGMHRLGLSAQACMAAWQRLRQVPGIEPMVLASHFARADELDCARTREQAEAFAQLSARIPLPTSLSNSPALLGWPDIRGDWSRAGLMLYGATPFPAAHPQADRLRPVMTLESQIIAVRELPSGEPIGYGGRFVTRKPSRIGVVALGYADGYPQFAPDDTPVAIAGKPGHLIGRVSMDMLTVDLTDHPYADIGTPVQLWGDRVAVSSVAAHSGISVYPLLCGLKRAPRVYIDTEA